MSDARSALLAAVVLTAVAAPGRAIDVEGDLSVAAGYRGDDLRLKADSCAGCEIVRVKFKNADATIIGADFRMVVAEYLYTRGAFDFGWYDDANFRVAVDGEDGPGPRPFRVRGDSNGDWLVAASGGLGFQVAAWEDQVRIGILGGYSYDEQRIKSSNEKVTLENGEETERPFPRIKWDTEWRGPWVGIDLTYQINERFRIMGTFEYHWMDFDGKLRLIGSGAIPDSETKQNADGDGYVWAVKTQYTFYDWLILRLDLSFRDWEVDEKNSLGKDDTRWESVRFTGGFVVPF